MQVLVDYNIRGGQHPDLRREHIEKRVAEVALNNYLLKPGFNQKGLRFCYNHAFFHNTYGSCDTAFLDYLFDKVPLPEMVEVEVSTACDLRCEMCELSYWKEPARLMSFDDFKRIIDGFPNLKQVGLTGIGNSYLNPDYERMLAYLSERGVVVEIFDTFNKLSEENMRFLIRQSSVYKLYCSLDAATKETYEKVRKGARWENVMHNLKLFDRIKKEEKAHFPKLAFHYIISEYNKHEIVPYLQMIADLNIDVDFVQYSRVLHPYPEMKPFFINVGDDIKKAVAQKSEELRLEASFNVNTKDNKLPLHNCSVWWQPFIFVNGESTPCCSLNEQNDRPWQERTGLGNWLTEGHKVVWEKYKGWVKILGEGGTPASCERCVLFDTGRGVYYERGDDK